MKTVLKTLALVAALAAGPVWTPAHAAEPAAPLIERAAGAATQADVDELVKGIELPAK